MKNYALSKQTSFVLTLWYKLFYFFIKLNNYQIDFMNLGFCVKNDPQNKNMPFEIPEKINRSVHSKRQAMLYYSLLKGTEKNLGNALEIGSGYGGGAYFAQDLLNLKKIIGVDKNKYSIDYSNKKFFNASDGKKIEYRENKAVGSKEYSSFFDLVFCLEASFHFKNLERFFLNVYTLLNNNGVFLYGDIFQSKTLDQLRLKLNEAGFEIFEENDVSENVLLSIHNMQKSTGILRVMEVLILELNQCSFHKNSKHYKLLKNGTLRYILFKLRKKLTP